METFAYSCYALGISAVAVAMLAGCGGSQPPIGDVAVGEQRSSDTDDEHIPAYWKASHGRFSALS
ncbi:MAG: hypothetical protein WCC84_05640 [Candidatus Cybelea sp.]